MVIVVLVVVILAVYAFKLLMLPDLVLCCLIALSFVILL